jgi:DNA polymerase-1
VAPGRPRIYPNNDARQPVRIFLKQRELAATLPNGGNLHYEPQAVRKAFVLHLQTLRGLRTDATKVQTLEQEVEAKHALAHARFEALGIAEGQTGNKGRLQEFVTKAYHGNPPRAPKGGVATDRDTKLESGDPILIDHGNSGKNNKYRTTYLPKLKVGTTVPINPRYYGMAATTRVTSDYQQLPKKGGVRECHVARPGFVFCSVDYPGLELRTMSQRAIWEPEVGFSKMGDALLADLDTHVVAASEFMGKTYDEVFKLSKVLSDPGAVGMRDLGKVFNFGKGGGMGPRTLVYHARAKDEVRFCQLAKRLPEGKLWLGGVRGHRGPRPREAGLRGVRRGRDGAG